MQKLLHHFHHWFVPRESNNHRPRILHHQILFVFILFFVLAGLVLAPLKQAAPGVLGISYSISTADLLTLTNQQRVANGLTPLVMNDELTNAAQMKGADMMAKDYWAHFAPDGTSPWYWFLKAGYQYNYAGENLARGFTSAPDVVTAWMNSPEHRANMLSPNYNDVGFAVTEGTLTGEDTVLVVQEFGSRNSSDEVAAVNAPEEASPTPIQSGLTPVAPTIALISSAPLITVVPTAQPLVVSQKTIQQAKPEVAAVQSSPLINSNSFSKQVVVIVILLLLIALVIDIVVMQRKNVVRIVAHNVDHIIFFVMILLIIIFIIGKHFIL